MLSRRELALGVVGAWRLVRADRTALLCLDRTPRGFWRSFWVALIVAPAQALLVAINLSAVPIDAVTLHTILLTVVFYALDWLLLPAILSEIASRGGRMPQFVAYVVANNYAQILLSGFWLGIAAIGLMVSQDTGIVIGLLGIGLQGVYQYRLARIAFDLPPPPAAALAMATVIASFVIWDTFNAAVVSELPPGITAPTGPTAPSTDS